jgi:hypothetical protein
LCIALAVAVIVHLVIVPATFACRMRVFAVRLTVDCHRLVAAACAVFIAIRTGFRLFMAVGFGVMSVGHRWLPGSICGLVNTLKPLQGQDRHPEGP